MKRLAITRVGGDDEYIFVLSCEKPVLDALKECYKILHSPIARNLPEQTYIDTLPDECDGIEIYRWSTVFRHKVEKDETILDDEEIIKNGLERMVICKGPDVMNLALCSTKNLYNDNAMLFGVMFSCGKDGFFIKEHKGTLSEMVEYAKVFSAEELADITSKPEETITLDPLELNDTLNAFSGIKLFQSQVKADSTKRIEQLVSSLEFDLQQNEDQYSPETGEAVLYLFAPTGENELTMTEASQLTEELRNIFQVNTIRYGFSTWDKNLIRANLFIEVKK